MIRGGEPYPLFNYTLHLPYIRGKSTENISKISRLMFQLQASNTVTFPLGQPPFALLDRAAILGYEGNNNDFWDSSWTSFRGWDRRGR
jgi:hypothetical protein